MTDAMEKIRAGGPSSGVYKKLIGCLQELGPFETEVKKTSLHLVNRRAFLGIHPRSKGVLVNIVSIAPICSDRIRRSEQISKNRWHNELMISEPDSVDDQLVGRIGLAYLNAA